MKWSTNDLISHELFFGFITGSRLYRLDFHDNKIEPSNQLNSSTPLLLGVRGINGSVDN
ncbi:hypothetical protein HMPREF0541_01616 [Lacticaseibacillus rhamnosus ATCC 21052]|nr:hypothetical protein HMPREF0541_01616 [Lacticaseibacillus rhamnosus ATCC 21052]